MGYYTDFTLTATKTNFDYDLFTKEFDFFYDDFGTGVSAYEVKWYSHEEDMKAFSLKHPKTLFTLSGRGEDREDFWIKYFYNGRVQVCQAQIIIPELDEEALLKEPEIFKVTMIGEGYYSGAEHCEVEFVKTSEEKLKALLPKSIWVGDLDGKHSEVECKVTFEKMQESDFSTMAQPVNYGTYLSERLYQEDFEVLSPTFGMNEVTMTITREEEQAINALLEGMRA